MSHIYGKSELQSKKTHVRCTLEHNYFSLFIKQRSANSAGLYRMWRKAAGTHQQDARLEASSIDSVINFKSRGQGDVKCLTDSLIHVLALIESDWGRPVFPCPDTWLSFLHV